MLALNTLDEKIEIVKYARVMLKAIEESDELSIMNVFNYKEYLDSIPACIISKIFRTDDFERVCMTLGDSETGRGYKIPVREMFIRYEEEKNQFTMKITGGQKDHCCYHSLFDLIFDILSADKIDEAFLERLRKLAE